MKPTSTIQPPTSNPAPIDVGHLELVAYGIVRVMDAVSDAIMARCHSKFPSIRRRAIDEIDMWSLGPISLGIGIIYGGSGRMWLITPFGVSDPFILFDTQMEGISFWTDHADDMLDETFELIPMDRDDVNTAANYLDSLMSAPHNWEVLTGVWIDSPDFATPRHGFVTKEASWDQRRIETLWTQIVHGNKLN